MTLKEQLVQEIGSTPDRLVIETLDFLRSLKAKEKLNLSTCQSLLDNLKTIGSWRGDDFDECFQSITATRLSTEFNLQANSFNQCIY
jgi:hypothetical protein